VRTWLPTVLLAGFLTACGSTSLAQSQTVSPTQGQTTYIEVGSGADAIYLVSDTDPTAWPDTAQFASSNSRKVNGLPDGVARACDYNVSRMPLVEIAVWTTGATASAELARVECLALLGQ
jgi:hypothetical protein